MQPSIISSEIVENCSITPSDYSLPSNMDSENYPLPIPLDHKIQNNPTSEDPLDLNNTPLTNSEADPMDKMEITDFCPCDEPLYTHSHQPTVSSSSESSETPSDSTCTSYLSSDSSLSCQDWAGEGLLNFDILAPTVPDLSFAFTSLAAQKLPVHHLNTPVTDLNTPVTDLNTPVTDAEQPTILCRSDLSSKHESLSVTKLHEASPDPKPASPKKVFATPAAADVDAPAPNRNLMIKSPLMSSTASNSPRSFQTYGTIGSTTERVQRKKSFGFLLSGHKFRNSSHLESQLEFVTQANTPQDVVGPTPEPKVPVGAATAQAASAPTMSRVKHARRAISSFLRFGTLTPPVVDVVPNDDTVPNRRQLRFSMNLLDRTNLFCNPNDPHPSRAQPGLDIDNSFKPRADPTLSCTPTPHPTPSRSFLNLLSSKLK